MPDHAGFAAAVTIREHVLNTALFASYANGSLPRIEAALPGGPPGVRADLVVGQPEIACSGATNQLVLTLTVWGTLSVSLGGEVHGAQIIGELEILVRPLFFPGTEEDPSVQLTPAEDVVVRSWTVSVTSADTPPEVESYIAGAEFKDRLQTTVRFAIATGQFSFPSIDVSFLGAIAYLASSVDARVRDGALLLGFNFDGEPEAFIGNAEALVDFARSNDVAGVVNGDAAALMLDEIHTKIVTAVDREEASLDRFSVSAEGGFFFVSGRVSKSAGAVNFSFRVVPAMFHTRPGAVLPHHPAAIRVKSRTWAVLEFHIEGVDTDVDRSWWVVVLEVFGAILTFGMATILIESMARSAGEAFSGRIKAARPGEPAARVRRTIPPTGGVGVRVGLDQFEVASTGVYVGISVRATPAAAALLGPTTVPSTYANDVLRFEVRLPSGVHGDDPALRLRWIVDDRTHNITLIDRDAPAGRRRLDFSPALFPGVPDFGITARLYRRLGPDHTDLANASVSLQVREALPPGAYIRWRSQVKNPQVAVDPVTDTWTLRGDAEIRRWSEWHRTDAPCRAVHAPNRFRFEEEHADRLPFPLRLLESHRKGLCPYCFYGGPSGINPAL
jgi:hypothetical protein